MIEIRPRITPFTNLLALLPPTPPHTLTQLPPSQPSRSKGLKISSTSNFGRSHTTLPERALIVRCSLFPLKRDHRTLTRWLSSSSHCDNTTTTTNFLRRFKIRQPRHLHFPWIPFGSRITMSAAEPEKTGAEVVKNEAKQSTPPPELPERPEPGDCCGSGCVRCVWDIYYDEMEDYNKRLEDYNHKSDAKSDSSHKD